MKLSMIKLKIQKRSPEILVITGVVGFAATVVTACVATTKLSKITDEHKEQLEAVRKAVEKDDLDVEYTEEDAKRDTRIIYIQTGVKITKLYAPAVIMGAGSLAALLASNGILKKRYAGMAAAYSAVSQEFKGYRKRVVERFGERVDDELKHGIKAVEIEKTTTDEKGKEKKSKETVDVLDPNNPGCYGEFARWFDESNPRWERNANFNKQFLIAQQRSADQKLKTQGYLFLNDVLEALGYEDLPKAGQIIGWIYDPDDTSGRFHNYIDLGIRDVYKDPDDDDPYILIKPNVDGNIWALMED